MASAGGPVEMSALRFRIRLRSRLTELLYSQDQIVSASYDRILRSWDVENGKQIRTFSGHSQSTLAVGYDPTGNVLASG